jgi:hypothetical protein
MEPAVAGQPAGKELVMSTRIVSPEQKPERARQLGRLAALLVGPIALATVAAAGMLVGASPADAATRVCGDRHQILKRLEQKHEEIPKALGLSADGGVLEVLVSPEGGWTMLVTYPKKPTCVLAVGQAWQMLQLAGGRPA